MRRLSEKQLKLAKQQADYINQESERYQRALDLEVKELLDRIYSEMLTLDKQGRLPSQFEISSNYYPEFISILRKHYSRVYNKFYNFNRTMARNGFDVSAKLKSVNLFEPDIEEAIDKEIDYELTLFINNESEKRAKNLAETTAKNIYTNLGKSNEKVQDELIKTQNEINKNNNKLSKLLIFGSALLRSILQKKNEKLALKVQNMQKNKTSFVSDAYEELSKADAVNRASIISDAEIGMIVSKVLSSESSAIEKYKDNAIQTGRYKGYVFSNVMEEDKAWVHTGESKTPRITHIAMNGEIKQEGYYSNGLRYPRDPEASPSETINCKCQEVIIPRDVFLE